MRGSWWDVSCRWLLLSAVAFACGGYCIYRAVQYGVAAPGEGTTTSYDVRIDYRLDSFYFRTYSYYFYKCHYKFSVDGAFYIGDVDCPRQAIDDSIKGKMVGNSGSFPIANAIVYYDPADPSMSGLIDFSATSENYYVDAALWTFIGLSIGLLFVYHAVLVAKDKGKNQRIFVDARGTVIYPEEINFDLGSDELFGKGRKAERGYSAANGEAANAANSDPSHRLRELYLDVVKHIHPDRALNEPDRAVRERLMKDANAAFQRGDAERLRSVLEEYRNLVPAL
jgi:hypothetical protein